MTQQTVEQQLRNDGPSQGALSRAYDFLMLYAQRREAEAAAKAAAAAQEPAKDTDTTKGATSE